MPEGVCQKEYVCGETGEKGVSGRIEGMECQKTECRNKMSENGKCRRACIGLWLSGGLLCLWYLLYVWVQAAGEEGAKGVHMEWEAPAVSWQELEQARESEAIGEGYFFYLWGQQEETARNPETGQEIEVEQITGQGEMMEALPVALSVGGYPWDKEGCLVSQRAAEMLWGSQDVAGQMIELGNHRLIITGVTREQKAKVYCLPEEEKWEQEKQPFLECYTASEAASAETVRTQKALAEVFLSRHGLPVPQVYTDYSWQSELRLTGVRFIGFLLLVLLVRSLVLSPLRVLWNAKRQTGQEGRGWLLLAKTAVWAVMIALLWYSLSWVVQDFTIPEDWIPPAWSDFGFWGEKWREWKG